MTHFVIGLAGHPGHRQVQLAGPRRMRGVVVGRRGLPLEPSVDGGQHCLPGRLHPQRGCAPRHGQEPPLGGGRAAPHRGAPSGALRGVRCGGQVPGRRGLLHQAAPEDQPSSRGGVHPPPGHGHGADSGGLGAAASQGSPPWKIAPPCRKSCASTKRASASRAPPAWTERRPSACLAPGRTSARS